MYCNVYGEMYSNAIYCTILYCTILYCTVCRLLIVEQSVPKELPRGMLLLLASDNAFVTIQLACRGVTPDADIKKRLRPKPILVL